LYSTFIGDNTVSGSLADAFTNVTVFVEVEVDGAVLSPRERMASVGYALHAWGLSGNAGTTAGTHFLGTTDDEPLELHVNGIRAFSIIPATTLLGDPFPIMIGGATNNVVDATSFGSAILSGRSNTIGSNTFGSAIVTGTGGLNSAIVGGFANSIGDRSARSFIGGGTVNGLGSDSPFTAIGGGGGGENN